VRLAAALVSLVVLGGCAGDAGSHEPRELTVLAAASLTDVFEALAEDFEAEYDAEVTLSFGSSTDLAEQAADGAPGDVLATADEASMALALDAGVAEAATIFARNVLTIVTPPDNPADIGSLDDLAGATWVRCADEAPCGRVALAVLDGAGVTAEPASLEEDVRATLDKVTSGEADAGLVYASDAVAAADAVGTVPIPDADLHRTDYLHTAVDSAGDPELAGEWIDFVESEDGRRTLVEAGFSVPPQMP
jgi:molybdate transport system substrate-binding protein